MIVVRWLATAGLAAMLMSGCGFGSSAEFKLINARVQPNYVCPGTTSDSKYGVEASINTRNDTSAPVLIKSVSALMTLAVVHGGWMQPVGYRYDAGRVASDMGQVPAGSTSTIAVTIPSACRSKSAGVLSYGDYSVTFTVATSAGTFKIDAGNRHRIIA